MEMLFLDSEATILYKTIFYRQKRKAYIYIYPRFSYSKNRGASWALEIVLKSTGCANRDDKGAVAKGAVEQSLSLTF